MKNKQYLTGILVAACAASANAQSFTWRAQQGPDLRSMLKQPASPPQGASPRQLSNEERAALRRQLAQHVRHDAKRP